MVYSRLSTWFGGRGWVVGPPTKGGEPVVRTRLRDRCDQVLETELGEDECHHTVHRLLPDTLYRIRVSACDSTGHWSPWSKTMYCSTLPLLKVCRNPSRSGIGRRQTLCSRSPGPSYAKGAP